MSVKYRSCQSSIGHVSVRYRSCIGQVSVMYRSGIGQVSVKYRWFKIISVNTFIGRLSADISVDYRPTVGRLSTDRRQSPDSRPIYRPMYRPICRPRPPIVHMIPTTYNLYNHLKNFNSKLSTATRKHSKTIKSKA